MPTSTWTTSSSLDDIDPAQWNALRGADHPFLRHEFLSALVEDRDPAPNAIKSANWTCVGLCAHESALKGGKIVHLPDFTLTS